MSDEALDLRRSIRLVRRHKLLVGAAVLLGLLAGVGYALITPPRFTSTAVVLLPPAVKGIGAQPIRNIGTQTVVADSNPVLAGAMRGINPPVPLAALRDRVLVSSPSPDILAFSAQGTTAAQAVGIANAVAASYVAFVRSPGAPDPLVLGRAANATGTSLASSVALDGGLAAGFGALAGAVVALAIGRGDRRLRKRDEIADATGAPVLASIPVRHPSDARGWIRLFEDYQPEAAQAWSMRRTLHQLGLTNGTGGTRVSLAVASLSTDHRALALGPQLAAFAASAGIPTNLVLGTQTDTGAAAPLRAACAGPGSARSDRSGQLQLSLADQPGADRAPLTVIVTILDARSPRLGYSASATETVLGVSAGAVTAEQLARVTISAASDGRRIAGIFVADPDSADRTTGRCPQPAQRRPVTRPTAQ
jgi:capsular polysaccharide biosynthesis protein